MKNSLGILILFSTLLVGCNDHSVTVKSGNSSDREQRVGSYFNEIHLVPGFVNLNDGTEFRLIPIDLDVEVEIPLDEFRGETDQIIWRSNPILVTHNDGSDEIKIYNFLHNSSFKLPGNFIGGEYLGDWDRYNYFIADTIDWDTEIWRTEIWRTDGTLAGTQKIPFPFELYGVILKTERDVYFAGMNSESFEEVIVKLDMMTFTPSVFASDVGNYFVLEDKFSDDKALIVDGRFYNLTTGVESNFPFVIEGIYDQLRVNNTWQLRFRDTDDNVYIVRVSATGGVSSTLVTPYFYLIEDGYCFEVAAGLSCNSAGIPFSMEGSYLYEAIKVNNEFYYCSEDECYSKVNGIWKSRPNPNTSLNDSYDEALRLQPWMKSKLVYDLFIIPDESFFAKALLYRADDSYRHLESGHPLFLLNKYVEPKNKKPRYAVRFDSYAPPH